jgi:hypothetical protein
MPVMKPLQRPTQPRGSTNWRTIAVLVLATWPVVARTTEPPALIDLLAGAARYASRFERDFSLLISDEVYVQHADGRKVFGLQERRTQATMLFLWLPEEREWLTVRSVTVADGKPVSGSAARLNEALASQGDERLRRLRELIHENARFNIGRTFRNFNYPTLVLSYLDPSMQPRFSFSLAGRETVRGVETWKLNYVERTTPTVIQGDGDDRRSRGSVWIAASGGTLVRSRLGLVIPRQSSSASATVDVDYQEDRSLGMWVPVRMRETYIELRGSVPDEHIGGEAAYSNYRRIDSAVDVLPPDFRTRSGPLVDGPK